MKLVEAMHKGVFTVTESATLREAATVMNKHQIGSVIVVRAGKPVGIVTERDILRAVAKGMAGPKVTVKTLMSRPIIVGDSTAELRDAISIMVENNIKKLPVVQGSKMVGIVTLTDFARLEPIVHQAMHAALQAAKEKVRRKFEKFLALRPVPDELYV